jgi:chemotaxis signal transduction protein
VTPRIVLFRVGEEPMAIPLEGVWRILPAPRVFPLLMIRSGFRGVFLHQATVVPLLDLALLLLGEAGLECAYTLLYGTDLGPVGLPVDQVLQIVERRLGTVEARESAPPSRFPATNSFVYNGNAYPLLDVEALLNTIPR